MGGHQFPKLRLKVRANLVQLAGGTRHLPITDPQARSACTCSAHTRVQLHNKSLCATHLYARQAEVNCDKKLPACCGS